MPRLEAELPLVARPSGRCLLGSSFGAVAALCTAYRAPDTYGSLVLMSGSFVFTDIAAADHGGGPVFDPVVKFVNRYRARPASVADRLFVSCGVYEPLITPNRSMVPTFESAGMAVRFQRDPRRPQLGELARQPARRPVVGLSRAAEAVLRVTAHTKRLWTGGVARC